MQSYVDKYGMNPIRTRKFNKQLVLQSLRLFPNITRTELAKFMKLSAPSVTNIVNDLIENKYIIETRKKMTFRGQPGICLSINDSYYYSIGLHFDHNFYYGVVASLAGDIISEQKVFVESSSSDRTISIFSDMFYEFDELIRNRQGVNLGLGISSMGPIYSRKDMANLNDDTMKKLLMFSDKIEETNNIPIIIENSATVSAIGEFWFGKGNLHNNYLYLNIGYGLGGGVIIKGRVYHGQTNNSGEIGHFNVIDEGRSCFCGGKGCLESYLSLNSLIETLGKEYSDVNYILEQFINKNPELLGWLDFNLPLLAKVIVSSTHLLDINVIIIGGLMPQEIINWYIDNLPKYIEKYRIRNLPSKLKIYSGLIQENISALGATTLATYLNLFSK